MILLIIDGKILSIEDNKVSLKKDETIEGEDAFIINYLNNIIKIDTKEGFPYIQFLEKQNDLKNFQIHDPKDMLTFVYMT